MDEGGVDESSYLQYTNFLSLSDKESVILSGVIPVYIPGKPGEIKVVSSSQDSFVIWTLDATLIG